MDYTRVITNLFTPAFGLLFIFIFLTMNSSMEGRIKRLFYIAVGISAFETIVSEIEMWTETFSHSTMLRNVTDHLGYMDRPFILYTILLIVMREDKNKRKKCIYVIPALINVVLCLISIFNGMIVNYSESNVVSRGSLGFVPYVISGIYLIIIFVYTIMNVTKERRNELIIISAIMIMLGFTIALIALFRLRQIFSSALALSLIFYYIYFQIDHSRKEYEEKARVAKARAEKDALTGIRNRGAGEADINDILKDKSSGIFGMFDCDKFKLINEEFGHDTGDRVLIAVADTMTQSFRGHDVVMRLSSDEFAFFLRGITDYKVAKLCLDRFMTAISEIKLDIIDNKPVTISMGAVLYDGSYETSFEELFKRADDELFYMKKMGRNNYRINQDKPKPEKK